MKDTKMNLNDMTAAELRKLAAQFKIAGRSTMKKAELVAALSAPEIADVVELSISLDEPETAPVAATSPDHNPSTGVVAAIDVAAPKSLPYRNRDAKDVELNRNVRVDITRYDAGRADARMVDRYGFEFFAQVMRQGRRWVLVEDNTAGPKPLTIRARSLDKLAKAWARKLGNWADDIRVARAF